MTLRPARAFLSRAATRERAILTRLIGHPIGVLAAANDAGASGAAGSLHGEGE